jgi:hypothetical protein
MKLIPWISAACIATCLPLQASVLRPVELSDQEMSQLRGRYVMPGRVISFGIVMSSTWKNAAGDNIGAKVAMQVQQSTIKTQFYVTTISQTGNGSTPAAGNGSISGGAGLSQTQGVTQSVRSAGNFNSAYNNVSIDVSEANQAPAAITPAGQALTQPITASNGAGSVTVTSGNGGLQMAILANGQGNSLQQIGAGNLLQAANLVGSRNDVQNIAALSVVLSNNQPSVGSLNCNLDQLRNLRPSGL